MTNVVDPLSLERTGSVREVGGQAIWSLSSCKPGIVEKQKNFLRFKVKVTTKKISGFGVDQLRDDRVDTYWQSDGQLPHLVNIQFQRKTTVSDIYIYIDYKLDESYTPSRVSIRIGTHFNDLQEIEVIPLTEPSGNLFNTHFKYSYKHLLIVGWVHIPIKDIREKPIRMFMIQIAVTSNHQNGRDTHMRQIKIHSPTEGQNISVNNFCNFSTVDFQQFATIR